MLSRRRFLLATAALAAGSASYAAWNIRRAANRYSRMVQDTWRHTPETLIGAVDVLNREMVRYATLAASSHNTQCWKFRIEDPVISILPDYSRRCPAVDPDDHHLFVSLGCAVENLVQAAQAFGKKARVSFNSTDIDHIRVELESARAERSPLYDAIPHRQCTRAEYNGLAVGNNDLKRLESVAIGKGVNLLLFTGKERLEKILEYVVEGNTAQISDPAFMEELKSWIRFSDDEAVSRGDGLGTRSTGNPVAPRWLGTKMFDLFFTNQNENEKYAKQIHSSAGVAIFVSDQNNKEHWVETGRCYERFALQATALGMKNAFLNQPVEVSGLRPQFASYLGIGNRRPDLVVRFGYGPEMPRSMRRPLEDVIV